MIVLPQINRSKKEAKQEGLESFPRCVLTAARERETENMVRKKKKKTPVPVSSPALRVSEFGWTFRRINSEIDYFLFQFCPGAELYSVDESGVQLCLQSRFSGTQKPITGAEPISYLQLKPLFAEQVQLQYFAQFMDCVSM